MSFSAQHLWLIPALPLFAAVIGALLPRNKRTFAASISIVGISASFFVSLLALLAALRDPAAHHTFNFTWFDLGPAPLRLGFLLDPLTAFMGVMVTFVSTLIFIFSLGYMKDDANFTRFFCFLSLFAAAMLGILVANSLLLLFISWELVGLASYLLIGFWFHKPAAAAAAKKAFITTRIGDLGFLLGLLWLYDASGSLLFYDGGAGILETTTLASLSTQTVLGGLAVSTGIGLLLFCGAVGKSGQFPLHVWLPDAMEGPTPVSALIHAATMVAAGVLLMARVFPLLTPDTLNVIAFVGATTALLGACLAVAQNDLKRILAYSTVSQLGYMMLAIGVGAWTAAIFHLLTHAFFKALLFLGAGSVIHAAHHEQDIRRLGGLAPKMKLTFATFAIGMMALAGVPFLFSGFWSKEAILHAAHAWPVSHLPFYVGLVAVVLTAFYMTRLLAEVFLGKPRSPSADHAHENSAVMTVPLVLLAACAILLGFLGTPAWPWLQAKLSASEAGRVVPNAPILFDWHALWESPGLMLLSIALVGVGLALGAFLYARKSAQRTSADARDPLASVAPRIFITLANRLYFDELYAATFGRLTVALARVADFLDRFVFDGVIRAISAFARVFGLMNQQAEENAINAGFDTTSEKLRASAHGYSRRQTGAAHGYLLTLAVAFAVLALVLVIGGAR